MFQLLELLRSNHQLHRPGLLHMRTHHRLHRPDLLLLFSYLIMAILSGAFKNRNAEKLRDLYGELPPDAFSDAINAAYYRRLYNSSTLSTDGDWLDDLLEFLFSIFEAVLEI